MIDGSTWDPFGAAPALHDRGRLEWRRHTGDTRLPVQGHDALGRARPGRLRGHPERRQGQRLPRRGQRRLVRHGQHARQAAEQLPLSLPARRPGEPRQGRQAAGAAGRVAVARRPDRLPRRPGRRGHPRGRHAGPAHLRQDLQDDVGHDPRHRQGRHGGVRCERGREEGRRHALQAARERRQFKPGTGFTKFFFDETGDTSASTEAGAAYGGFGGAARAAAGPEAATPASCRSSTSPTRRTRASTTSRSSTRPT